MSRKLLILSAILLVVGVAILIYADPLARLSLGGPGTSSRTISITRTFTFGNQTTTIGPGASGFPGGTFATGGRAFNTSETLETLLAMGLVGVGLVLEVVTIFLWQGQKKVAPQVAQA